MLGRVAVGVVLGFGRAVAQPAPNAPPTTSPTPTPASVPTTTAPATAATVAPNPDVPVVDRHGLVLLAGVSLENSESSLRVDAFVPVMPHLRLGASFGFDHSSASIPNTVDLEAYSFSVVPTASYEWRLPIASTVGDFYVTADGGVSYGRAWLKIDQPFIPGKYESITGVGLLLASSFQFRATNGFIVSVQPLGVAVPVWNSQFSNPNYMVKSDVTWIGALLAGYQFQ